MNVSQLCNFLERQNNAVFVSQHEDSERWADDPTSIMFVNNQSHLMRVDQKGNKTLVPWEQARSELALQIRKHSQGYVTLAAFQTEPRKALNFGSQWAAHEIGGTQPPLLLLIVGVSALVAVLFLVLSTRKRATPEVPR